MRVNWNKVQDSLRPGLAHLFHVSVERLYSTSDVPLGPLNQFTLACCAHEAATQVTLVCGGISEQTPIG
jgi:hypothetical protein